MRNRILKLFVVIAAIAILVSPAAAIVTPPTKITKTFEYVWTAIMDLQSQILNIQPVHLGAWQNLPASAGDGIYRSLAETDGFVTCTCDNWLTDSYVTGFVGGMPIVQSSAPGTSSGIGGASITMPVRKGDHYEVMWSDPCENFFILKWVPLSV